MAISTSTLKVLPPDSPEYRARRNEQIRELRKMQRPGQDILSFRRDLYELLQDEMSRPSPKVENGDLVKSTLGGLRNAASIPDSTKAILDSTGGGTSGGSVLIRQDLEPILHL